MVGQDIIHAGRFDDAAERGMGPHIGNLFPQAPDLPAVIQAFQILFNGFDHGSLSFRLEGNVDRCSLLLLFLRFQYDISIHGQRASFADR